LIQPAFHRERVVAFGTLMTETTLTWTQRWKTSNFVDTHKPLDLTQEMSSLTLSIVGQALFGTDLRMEMERVGQALTTVSHLLAEAFYLPWALSLPTPQRHRLYAERLALYTVVEELIRERRGQSAHDDLLAMLLQARDEETGEGMTNQ
jgi:cytochrome P450